MLSLSSVAVLPSSSLGKRLLLSPLVALDGCVMEGMAERAGELVTVEMGRLRTISVLSRFVDPAAFSDRGDLRAALHTPFVSFWVFFAKRKFSGLCFTLADLLQNSGSKSK